MARNRSALVTGADGFIGSHLVEQLVHHEWQVRAMVYYNSHQTAGWLDHINEAVRDCVEVVLGDVRDRDFVRDAMNGADTVFHLAALISIPHSYVARQSYIDTNVMGTFNVLESAREIGTSKLIVTSTSEVYGTPASIPITLEHSLNAQSPYAATKIAADQLALSYAVSFDLPVNILRPFNTYGPRQSPRAVISSILSQMLSGASEIHVGSLHPKRDFTYVDDTTNGFLLLAESSLAPGEIVQLGSGAAVSIGELVALAREVVGWDGAVTEAEERVRPERSEVQVLLADASSAEERIGWSSQTSLEAGLVKTRDWMLDQDRLPDARTYFR